MSSAKNTLDDGMNLPDTISGWANSSVTANQIPGIFREADLSKHPGVSAYALQSCPQPGQNALQVTSLSTFGTVRG
jgi:hypothetical protein